MTHEPDDTLHGRVRRFTQAEIAAWEAADRLPPPQVQNRKALRFWNNRRKLGRASQPQRHR